MDGPKDAFPFRRFDTIAASDRHTDGWTDGHRAIANTAPNIHRSTSPQWLILGKNKKEGARREYD